MEKNVKLLKVKVKGCSIYENSELTVELYNKKRINPGDEESLNHLFSNVYTSPINAIVGINASGKSTTLDILTIVLDLFVQGMPISRTKLGTQKMEAFLFSEEKEITFEVYLYNGQKSEIIELISTIGYSTEQEEVVFKNEKMKKKQMTKVHSKKEICHFDDCAVYRDRMKNNNDIYISDDVSIIRMEIERSNMVYSFVERTRYRNQFLGEKHEETIQYLDGAIERLEFLDTEQHDGRRRLVKIKYQNGKEQVIDSSEVNQILSSGTNKGMQLFPKMINCLKKGGYLIIDEIENNLNKSIVIDILKIFLSKSTNPHNATLIFATHYSELLDNIDRNDFVYITHKSASSGVLISRFSDIVHRSDVKKSDAIMSDYLGLGTAPSSQSCKVLRNFIENEVNVREED